MELGQKLELARIQLQAQIQTKSIFTVSKNNTSKHKFALRKLQFEQFDCDLKRRLLF